MERNSDVVLDEPVFIVGAGRSGTSWLQRLMLANPGVCGGPESNFFSCFAPGLRSFHKSAGLQRHAGLANFWTLEAFRDELRELWRKTMRPIVDASPGARMLLEKTPSHALWMAEIDELLPRCRFIHLVRDSRAVVASLLSAGRDEWGSPWAPKGARDAAIQWFRHVRAAREYGATLDSSRYLELRYEDLHADTAARVSDVYDFIGLPMPRADIERIVDEQRFDRQKAIGGTPFTRAGDLAAAAGVDKEPAGFFRQGTCDGWKKELSLRQQIIVWRYTRKLMRTCGYGWSGVRAAAAPATIARVTQAAAPVASLLATCALLA